MSNTSVKVAFVRTRDFYRGPPKLKDIGQSARAKWP
jgi:hypothetical protein